MEKSKLIIGQDYIYTIVRPNDDKCDRKPQREKIVVRCVGIYRNHVRFDFGKHTRSLTWWDIAKEIRTMRGGEIEVG